MKFIKIGNKLNLIKPDSCYYMGGVNVLPPPLTVEEEKELLKKLEWKCKNYINRKKLKISSLYF